LDERHSDTGSGLAYRTILVAGRAVSRRRLRMGAKYLPTVKDLKLNRRFQEKQNPLPFTKKPTGLKGAKKTKKP